LTIVGLFVAIAIYDIVSVRILYLLNL